MKNKSPRILIGLSEIVGYNGSLKKGFDEICINADFAELSPHPFQYGSNSLNNGWIRIIKYFGRKRVSTPRKQLIRKIFWMSFYQLSILPFFFWALIKYDTFIFGFGESFFRLHDLPILKFFNKKIIFIFFGSESRPPYINAKYIFGSLEDCIRITREANLRVQYIERYADVIINHPPTSHFHKKKFIQFMRIGIPTSFGNTEFPYQLKSRDKAEIRILHAPSVAEGKGTDLIRKAIGNLKDKGYKIQYIELVNRPNSEVLDELQKSDFIVDELYSDAVMARFAAEAAFFGKPAIVGGYAKPGDWGELPCEAIPPVHHCRPEQIEEAIEFLIRDKRYRYELGARAKQFLDRYWAPQAVARRLLQAIQGDIPSDWYFDPNNIAYLYGWGIQEDRLRVHLKSYIERFGQSALMLDDKPELRKLFVDFAFVRGTNA